MQNSRSLNKPISLHRMPVVGRPAPAYLQRRTTSTLYTQQIRVHRWFVLGMLASFGVMAVVIAACVLVLLS